MSTAPRKAGTRRTAGPAAAEALPPPGVRADDLPPASSRAAARAVFLAIAGAAWAVSFLGAEAAAQGPPVAFTPVSVSWTFEARHADCPQKAVFSGSISFPRNTGGEATDQRLASMAEEWLLETRARALADIGASQAPCAAEEGRGLYTEITYELFRPSPGVLGLLFTDRGYDGGARGWLGYTAYTFDLASGRPLAPFDLFPDRKKASAGLWSLVWTDSCLKDPPRETLPRFYGGTACAGKTPPPPPEGFMEDAEELEDLGSLVLTEKGAVLNIDPSSAWSWAEGPYRLEIPRTELVGWGADPALWETRPSGIPTMPLSPPEPAPPAPGDPEAAGARSPDIPGATPASEADGGATEPELSPAAAEDDGVPGPGEPAGQAGGTPAPTAP
ncbi:MAG: hypothetical protein LBQ79_11705 [Deltaproteobacteria bacterium]|nr:hypothetical protein [Deltaproteobacteria bacterium]